MLFSEKNENIKNHLPGNIIYLICNGISFVLIVLGAIYVTLKKHLFIIFKLLLMIQLSEGLNCISKFLYFFKSKDNNLNILENSKNKTICGIQISFDFFADFCTLSFNAYVSYVLYIMLKTGNMSSSPKIKLGIVIVLLLIASIIFSCSFVLIDFFAIKRENHTQLWCSVHKRLDLGSFGFYWAIILVNCFFLGKSICHLKKTAKSLNVANEEINNVEEEKDICEITVEDSDIGLGIMKRIKNFIKKFSIFIALVCIIWFFLFITHIFEVFQPNSKFTIALGHIHGIVSSLLGVFYSYCYFFILTNFGSNLFRNCCFCCEKNNEEDYVASKDVNQTRAEILDESI